MQTVCLFSIIFYGDIRIISHRTQAFWEPILSNHTDLMVLGGLTPVVELLNHGLEDDPAPIKFKPTQLSPDIRAASAHVIGTAASNNVQFQQQILDAHPHIFRILVRASKDPAEEVAVKVVYAMAAMVRNLPEMQDAFFAAGAITVSHSHLKSFACVTLAYPFAWADGFAAIEQLLTTSGPGQAVGSIRVGRKALAMLLDLLEIAPGSPSQVIGRSGE